MGRDRPPCPEVLPSPCISGPTLTDLGAALRREAPAHGAVGARPAGAPSLHVLPPGPPEKAGKGRASLQYMRRDEGGRRGEEGGARGRTERRDPDAGAAPELRVQPTLKGGLGGSASGALEGGRTGHPGQKGSWGCPGWALTGRGWAAGGRFGTRGPRHSGGPGQGRNPCSSRTHYSWLGEPSRRRLRSLQTLRPGRETECPVLPRACPGPSGPGPPPLEAPPHLGGGQLQVENRFRPGKQLDLLHQMHSAVLAHDSLVQGARGCGETESCPCPPLGPGGPSPPAPARMVSPQSHALPQVPQGWSVRTAPSPCPSVLLCNRLAKLRP